MVEHFLTHVEDFWEAQAALVSTVEYNVCGHLLIISADYMVHQYGSDEDWDRYAELTGDSGWAWSNVKNYVKKVLHFNAFNNLFYIKLNADWISSTKKSYLQTMGMIQLANLSRLCMVSVGRSPSAFQGST